MRLLMTASSFAHIHSFHLPYIKGFHDAGWEVDVACGGSIKGIPFAEKLIQLPMEKRMLSVKNFQSARVLRSKIRDRQYDLVIVHTSLAAFCTRLALCGLRGAPKCINVVHGYLFYNGQGKLKATLLKTAELMLSHVTDLVLTMNEYDYLWAKRHKVAKKVGFIPGMGADEERVQNKLRHDYGFEKEAFILIYPAEFSKRKNQSVIISAIAQLPYKVKLILPGNGALLELCRQQAERLGVSDRVVFPGYVTDIIPWIMGANASITSSLSEGLPFNVLEAMQCGLPVIASRAKGNTELVADGINGYLFDDIEGLIRAVKILLSDPGEIESLGEKGREMADEYSLKNAYPKVMESYMRCFYEA